VTEAAWVCLLAPLGGALAVTLLGTRISRRTAGYLSTLSVLASAVAAAAAFFAALGRDPEDRGELSTAWTWLTAAGLDVDVAILVDPLSLMMSLVVSGVGFLIVAYSIGYMDGDDEERRFFAYMALFVFSMLLLVLSGNFLLLLVGWGLVGLSSYLLIGFHHERASAVAAAKKAFVMNAVGDAAMALGDRHARLRPELRRGRGVLHDGRDARRAGPARGRGRQVGAGAAPHLAAGRHGGANTGQRPHPCSDDGHRRRVPHRPLPRHVRGGAVRPPACTSSSAATPCSRRRRSSRTWPPGSAPSRCSSRG
jgi:hypothetical protein